MQSVLIIQCFICKKCADHAVLLYIMQSAGYLVHTARARHRRISIHPPASPATVFQAENNIVGRIIARSYPRPNKRPFRRDCPTKYLHPELSNENWHDSCMLQFWTSFDAGSRAQGQLQLQWDSLRHSIPRASKIYSAAHMSYPHATRGVLKRSRRRSPHPSCNISMARIRDRVMHIYI